ncbi:hypothetical protein DCCM_3250 [Desulfocucumis palustris]|uniref:Phage major capsid protein n=1 Tax=Desulfocucumis palustris TaxID=1898651 RepID=A0A2L2XD16_9FIRM|nr:major capsid protein [Desulfocucumis palustris]GBF34138.1 hypothetical protein DCCM_3250 [Desulfocucumis palustris]
MPIEDITALGTTVLTDLARTFENHKSNVGVFLPPREVPAAKVETERIYGGVGMAPTVTPGQPDVFGENSKFEKTAVDPVFSRESFSVDTNTLNSLRMPGTLNEKYGRQYVADEMKRYVARNDLLFDFLKTQMLQGGVDYTDPRTNKRTQLSAGIPASHIITDVPTTDWDDSDAPVIDDLEEIKLLIKDDGKVSPTHIMMNSIRRSKLSRNKQVLARGESARDTGFVVFKDGELARISGLEIVVQDTVYEALSPASVPTATITITEAEPAEGDNIYITAGGVKTGTYTAVAGETAQNVAANLSNFVNGNPAIPVVATVAGAVITLTPKYHLQNQSLAISTTGNITATVAGSPLAVSSSGLVKAVTKMVPDHKIVVACQSFGGDPLGRTDYVMGEHPQGKPGIWSRAADTVPPAAPGVLVQVGRAGMPYLLHPDWVVVRDVAEAS